MESLAESLEIYLQRAVEAGVSDVMIIAGRPLTGRLNSKFVMFNNSRLMPQDVVKLIEKIYNIAQRKYPEKLEEWDDDFSITLPDIARFRVNVYRQRGYPAAVMRVIKFGIPDYNELSIPLQIVDFWSVRHGLILVTGPTGSGKSTTIACILDKINKNTESHVITIEDPIEYVYYNDKSIFSQRELSTDTVNYSVALRAALRETPDVIMIGELRDFDTIQTAVTAAETGHLVISTMHTLGAANTVDRIIDVFPANQQSQIRIQLAQTLRSIVSQQLLPRIGGGRIPAFEILHMNPALQSYIREGKTHQISQMIGQSQKQNMVTMDDYMLSLYKEKQISRETLLNHAMNLANIQRYIKL